LRHGDLPSPGVFSMHWCDTSVAWPEMQRGYTVYAS
jgi:hypothetical protein